MKVKEMIFFVFLLFLIVLAWGFGDIFCKIASKSINPINSYLLQAIGGLVVTTIFLVIVIIKQPTSLNMESIQFSWWALFFGVFWGIGAIAFIIAMSVGKAAIVIPVSGLYVAVAVLLALFWLKESINLLQGVGIVLAIIAGILLSWPS